MTRSKETLGAYLRELRSDKEWTLRDLAERTKLNYQNLSRIENDSTFPAPETVVRLAEVLGGDLNLMLELADCLPKQILERLSARPTGPTMKRSAGGSAAGPSTPDGRAAALARSLGVPESELDDVAAAVVRLLSLDARRRQAIVQLMKTFDGGGGAQR